jgi:DNA-binding NtrC family response regulator
LRPLRILLVEDNPQVADVATALLIEHGHAVSVAGTADEALVHLHSDSSIELVFSDLVMPGELNGLDLARNIRAKWPSLPIVLATGYSDAAGPAREEGFTLLTKPYQPDALDAAIRAAVSTDVPSA